MNRDEHKQASAPASAHDSDRKGAKEYRPPTLIDWGDVAELTRGNTTGSSDGALTGSGTT